MLFSEFTKLNESTSPSDFPENIQEDLKEARFVYNKEQNAFINIVKSDKIDFKISVYEVKGSFVYFDVFAIDFTNRQEYVLTKEQRLSVDKIHSFKIIKESLEKFGESYKNLLKEIGKI